ncbi:MAG: 1-acyl-sn-glycerol-3-phosphate acyltransferase [Desulfobacterales bacterium]|nr:1-acyl-sn-glycerol-3-phosphate acyltransferase [Desulfobacterales bacterium]
MRAILYPIEIFGSSLLWAAGLVWFLVCFSVLSFGLSISSPRRLFPVVGVLTKILLRIMGAPVAVSGQQRLDPKRAYLFLGNHQSLFDLFALPAALPSFAVGVEAASHFTLPLWGSLTRRWGNIPIPRRNRAKAITVLDAARSRLQSGTSIVILPEGHRTRNGKLGDFKMGPFHLALAAKADIVPFAMCGLFRFQPKGRFLLQPGPVTVVFGPPIPYASVRDLSAAQLRDRVREEIAILLGQVEKNVAKTRGCGVDW